MGAARKRAAEKDPIKARKKPKNERNDAARQYVDDEADCDDDTGDREGEDGEDEGKDDVPGFVSEDSKGTPADKARNLYRQHQAQQVIDEATDAEAAAAEFDRRAAKARAAPSQPAGAASKGGATSQPSSFGGEQQLRSRAAGSAEYLVMTSDAHVSKQKYGFEDERDEQGILNHWVPDFVRSRLRTKVTVGKNLKYGSMGLKKDVISEQVKSRKKKDVQILHSTANIDRIRGLALKSQSGTDVVVNVEVDLVEAENMSGLGVARPINETWLEELKNPDFFDEAILNVAYLLVDDSAANEAGYPVRDLDDLVKRVNAGERFKMYPIAGRHTTLAMQHIKMIEKRPSMFRRFSPVWLASSITESEASAIGSYENEKEAQAVKKVSFLVSWH